MKKRKKSTLRKANHPVVHEPRVPERIRASFERLLDGGRWAEARALCLREFPPGPLRITTLRRLALLANREGRVRDAEAVLCDIIREPGSSSGDHYSLGLAREALSEVNGALESFLSCLLVQPDHLESLLHLAVLQTRVHRLEEAASSYRRALTLDPNDYAVAISLAQLLHRLRAFDEAIQLLTPLLANPAAAVSAHYVLGAIYQDRREYEAALRHYAEIRERSPNTVGLATNLTMLYTDLGRYDEAIALANSFLDQGEESAALYNSRANAYLALRRLEEAGRDFRRAFALDPEAWISFSNAVMILHYQEGIGAEAMALAHREYGRALDKVSGGRSGPWGGSPDPDRKIRIGYLSPDFRCHSVAFFFEPVLRHHNREGFEVFCYSTVKYPDLVTARFEQLADHWRDLRLLLPAQAEEIIRRDEIDILVDLAGHSGDNSLPLFGRKPAPVQVTWLGYPDTTGLVTMDYRLTDALADPPGEADRLCSEELIRLPHGFLCYQPVDGCPDVTPLPALTQGGITFGCFNKFDKISATSVALWSSILRALPGSRLLIKNMSMGNVQARESLQAWFSAEGIGPERLDLQGRTACLIDHLSCYGRVDIALDTYPYHGTTTTFEALWMGVPVVVLAGETHVSRVGVSILTQIGGSDLISRTPQQYKDIALSLAADIDRLAMIRKNLRSCLAGSPLTDGASFTEDLEEALRRVWRRACASLPRPGSGGEGTGVTAQ